jgi:hypothetical protein
MDITMDIIILCTRLKSDGELPASSFRLPAIPRKKHIRQCHPANVCGLGLDALC